MSVGVILLEVTAIVLLILLNGFFALAELAIVSARKAHLNQMARRGNANAVAALELANAPEAFLSTVQVGITLVGILAGAFGGATIAQILSDFFRAIPALASYADIIGFTVVVLAITYLSLIIGELVPKHLALSNPERLACAVARPVRFLSVAASPVVKLLVKSTGLVFSLFRIKSARNVIPSEEEIKFLMEQGTRSGAIHADESMIMRRVLRFGDKQAAVLMTPRTRLVMLNVQSSAAEMVAKLSAPLYTRYLVYEDSPENIIGYVDVRDLLHQTLASGKFELGTLVRQPLFVTEATSGLKLLDMFRTKGTHIALVIDEYGTATGIVTLTDVLEAILGDFSSYPAATERTQTHGARVVDGLMPIDDLMDAMNVPESREEGREFQTVAGLLLFLAQAIPQPGQTFEWKGLRLTVLEVDGVKIGKVCVQRSIPSDTDRNGTSHMQG